MLRLNWRFTQCHRFKLQSLHEVALLTVPQIVSIGNRRTLLASKKKRRFPHRLDGVERVERSTRCGFRVVQLVLRLVDPYSR